MATKRDQDNAFQEYTILQTNMVSRLPDHISFERAAVIPLGLSTAACGLFQDSHLNLRLPTEPARPKTGETLLVWGGASSVGSNAIQLAVAAGYEVITTASPKNFGYVKSLGASQSFDYTSPNVVADLVAAFKTKPLAGAMDCIGAAAWEACVEVVSASKDNKFVATTKGGFPTPPADITMKSLFGTTLKDNHVGKAIYQDFLPKALASGAFVPAPEPFVVGHGLESVQAAVDLLKKGVSARKIVVTL
jgi:NADPH:quinone reductase-like Zn-dependent oxidoreductase